MRGPCKEGFQGRRIGSEDVMRTVGRKGRMFLRTCSLNTSRSNPEGEEKWWRRTRDQTSCSKAGISSEASLCYSFVVVGGEAGRRVPLS